MYKKGDIIEIIGYQKNIPSMIDYIGKVCTIETRKGEWYTLENTSYWWKEDWLKPVEEVNIQENELTMLFE